MSHKREIDVDQLRDLIEVQRLQHQKVSAITGIPAKKMTKFCRRYGIKTQRTGPRSGPEHPDWKGGRYLCKGYWYIYSPNHPNRTKQGYILEHRLVVEQALGRHLDPKETVHHIDGDSQNNEISNLMLFGSNATHLKHELKGRVPNWTPDGFANMCKTNPKWAKNPRFQSKYDDGLPLRPISRQTS